MVKSRSRHLRRGMYIGEFQEVGLPVVWRLSEGTSGGQIDQIVGGFINKVIKPNKPTFDGSGYLAWESLTYLQETGKCIEEHQVIARRWPEEHRFEEVRTSELFDIWWD